MKIFLRFKRYIKDGFIGFFRNISMSISSVIAVTITLLLIGVFLVLNANINNISYNIQDAVSMIAMVDFEYCSTPTIENDQEVYLMSEHEQHIYNTINAIKGVSKIEFSSKDQEFDYYINIYGATAKELFETQRADNPFKDVFIITVDEDSDFKEIKNQVEQIPGIYSVQDGGQTTYDLLNGLNGIRNGSLILVLALIILSIYLIYNTIKITIQARVNEITIMRYVGARNGYIKGPFLIEGMLIGILGSILPIITIYFGYNYIIEQTGGNLLSSFSLILPNDCFILYGDYVLPNFSIAIILLLLLSGVLVGFIGSYISVLKSLRGKR